MTTQQTTYRFGALGNSGLGSGEERGFPSGKGRKKLFFAESAFIGPFGMSMPQVRTLSLRPKILIRKNGDFYFLPLTSSLLLQKMRLLSAKTDNSRKALYQTHFKCE